MDKKTPPVLELAAGDADADDRGVVVPFRRPTRTSTASAIEAEVEDEAEAETNGNSVLPAHDDPAFEALHRKGVRELLRADFKRRALQRDPPEKTPG